MDARYSKWRNSASPRDSHLIGIIMKKRFSGSRKLLPPVLRMTGAVGWRDNRFYVRLTGREDVGGNQLPSKTFDSIPNDPSFS